MPFLTRDNAVETLTPLGLESCSSCPDAGQDSAAHRPVFRVYRVSPSACEASNRRSQGHSGRALENRERVSDGHLGIGEEGELPCLARSHRLLRICPHGTYAYASRVLQFLSKYSPLYDRRLAIIQGKEEPTEVEIEAGQNADSDDEDEEEGQSARITEVKDDKPGGEDEKVDGVPEFWLTALRNHTPISDTITDRDEEVG